MSNERKGNYPTKTLPTWAQQTLAEKNPDWDWVMTGSHIVVRLFDDGEETERVVAEVVYVAPPPR